MGRLDDRLERLQAHLRGGVPPELGDLSGLHPLHRQKVIDEARGVANYTEVPDLSSLVASRPELAEGVRWVMKHDWTVASLAQYDYELLSGDEQAVDLAQFILEQEGIECVEQDMDEMLAAAQARLDALAQLPPSRWREVYREELEASSALYNPHAPYDTEEQED